MPSRLIVPRPIASRQLQTHSHKAFFSSLHSKMSTHQQQSEPPSAKKDWSATQYLKFGGERTRPVRDLVAQIPLASPQRIVDLGCGPGNSTAVLATQYPDAKITGMDSSPDMLRQARSAGLPPSVDFVQGDLRTFTVTAAGEEKPAADVLFSNAVFHWLRTEERIPTIVRLLQTQLSSGGVLAFQVPDNYDEPSHKSMRETALLDGPWTSYFQSLSAADRPDLDPVETPETWYNALIPYCATVEIWQSLYQHVMPGPASIVEWVKGTGLMPFLNALPELAVREAYLKAYEQRLAEVYPPLADGKVMLRYPRLFVVATRK